MPTVSAGAATFRPTVAPSAAPTTNAMTCPAGQYYDPSGGVTWCTNCPAGTYQPLSNTQAGRSSCLNCPVGKYNANSGSSVCVGCSCTPGNNATVAVGGSACTCTRILCPAGTYWTWGSAAWPLSCTSSKQETCLQNMPVPGAVVAANTGTAYNDPALAFDGN
jgi:hypothetical protein